MHIAFLTTEYPILGMKCGGIGIFIKHLSHLIVKSETGVRYQLCIGAISLQKLCGTMVYL